MKRFKILNKITGKKFSFLAESLESQFPNGIPYHVLGQPERWVPEFNASESDKASALETRISKGSMGEDVVEYKLPAQHEIIAEDATAEVNAEIAKKERLQALKDKHAAMKPSDLDTIVELRQAIFEIHELLGLK